MNIFDEIEALPRNSQIVLVAILLKSAKPTIYEISHASGIADMSLRGYLGIRSKKRPTKATP